MTNPTLTFARLAGLPLALALVLAACGSDTPVAPSGPTSTTASTAAPASSTTAVPVPTIDAVLAKLAPAGATAPKVNTEDDDPNKLLGRPGQYTARASFALPGGDTNSKDAVERGGVIEIHPDAAAVAKRSEFIKGLQTASPILGTEYHYTSGPVLVRVTGKVTPTNAKKIEDAVKQV